MNLKQLRYVVQVAQHQLNVSDAADTLFTSQPGVSKQIRQLEAELGIDIFARHGKRLTAITEPGAQIITIAERILREVDNLQNVGNEFTKQSSGRLSIATTHTQARYMLPPVIKSFLEKYPEVKLELHQGSPRHVCEMVQTGQADIAIATESIAEHDDLVSIPCYQWNRCIVATPRHPILQEKPLTLEALSHYPLITYDDAFTGRSLINKAFLGRGLKPNIILTAIDSDVIKTYVRMGLGVGILARMAFDPLADRQLGMLEASHLFESSTTRIGLRKNAYLRGYIYDFISYFVPTLTRKTIDRTLQGGGEDYSV